MLDLQARVHFEEVEIALAVDDELDRPGAVIVHGLGQRDRLLAHRLARLGREEGRWRLLEDFLVAALDRAFALVEVDDIAVLVAQHLDLDVARLVDELLDEDAIIAERGDRLGARAVKAFLGFACVEGDAQALAAAAGRGLDHHRIADRVGDLHRLLRILDQAHMTGHGADARFGGKLLRRDLVAHRLDGVRVRADEDDLLGLQALGESRRSRRGSRNPGGPPRRRTCARRRRSCPGRDSSGRQASRRYGPPRRPSRQPSNRHRRRNRRPPS